MTVPVKLTRAHQVTLPKRLLAQAGWLDQEYFVAELQGGALVLTPMTRDAAPAVASFDDLRRHFARLGVTQHDVADAVRWARRQPSAPAPRGKAKR